jgi:hypothetical protein
MVQGYVNNVDILHNSVTDVHSAGWCYGVEITPTASPLLGAYPDQLLMEDFEGTGLPSGWSSIDDDGDGYDWDCDWAYPIAGSESAGSASYINGVGALNPDNWLITPQIDLGGYGAADLTFWTKAQDASYPSEKIEVWISTSGNSVGDFTDKIYDFTETDDTPKEHILDLTAYADEQIYIAFRHTDTYDMYWLILDDVEVTAEQGGGPGPSGGPAPSNVDITCNEFMAIGDGSSIIGEQEYPGICVTIDETSPGADDGDASSIHVNCNNFELGLYALINKDTSEVLDAQYNWYGDVSGPSGGDQDPIEGIFADGFGAIIVDHGPIHFAPWLGVNAIISIPAADTINVEVGEPVLFDATGCMAVIFEECCDPFEAHI